jgi:hypothetical protein
LNLAAQRAFAGDWESHMPEIGFGMREFNANIRFAIAGAAYGDNVALHGLRGVVVDDHKVLADGNDFFHGKQDAVAIYGLGLRLSGKLNAFVILAMNGERYRKGYPKGAAAFFAAKVQQGHWRRLPRTRDLKFALALLSVSWLQRQANCHQDVETHGQKH